MMTHALAACIPLVPLVLAQFIGGEAAGKGALLWLLGLAAAAVIFNQVVMAFRNMTGRFAERVPGAGFQTREGCATVQQHVTARIDAAEQRSDTRDETLRREIKEDVKGVHKRSDQILAAVSRLEGKVDARGSG